MSDDTPRLALPLLAAGQAQKEMTHNEALLQLDLLVQAAVAEPPRDDPPADPVPGACWIVGPNPTGAWIGAADALALWSEGGWRFSTPAEGFAAWVISTGSPARFRDGAWEIVGPAAAIADPAGGTTVDTEARTAVAAILAMLRITRLVSA